MASEAKTVTLTHAERLEVRKILNTAKFDDLAKMGTAIEDARKVAHTPEEVEKINMHAVNDGQGIEWTEDDATKEIDLSPTTIDAVEAHLKAKEEAKDFTVADVALSTLAAKLHS